MICEKVLYASKDEQDYFNKSHKIYTKEKEVSNYTRQMPDYMRILDRPVN